MSVKAQMEKHLPPPSASFIYGVKPRFVAFWHFHPEYQLTLVVRGRGRRFVGDNVSRYESGDLVLTGPNLPHMWCSDQEPPREKRPPQAITIHFSKSVIGEEFRRMPELALVRRLLERSDQGIEFPRTTGSRVSRSMIRMRRLSGLARLIELLSILRVLSEAPGTRLLSSKSFMSATKVADRDRIDRICRYMAENAERPILLSDAAAASNMSVPTFTRFFRKCTGRTFVEHLTELRVGTACRLLVETDQTVAQVGYASGFANLSNFHRRFRKLKGMSPSEFRDQFSHRSPMLGSPGPTRRKKAGKPT